MPVDPDGPTDITLFTDLGADSPAAAPVNQMKILTSEELRVLGQRSNGKGVKRLVVHLSIMICSGIGYGLLILRTPTGARWSSCLAGIPLMVLLGVSFATMFACMHECLHRTAFRSVVLNDSVAWFAGLLSFYNSALFRYSHGWHHRFTQVPGLDPELEAPKPSSMREYWMEISGVEWWSSKMREQRHVLLGDLSKYPYVPLRARNNVIRSGRAQLFVYLLLMIGSVLLMAARILSLPVFVMFWLLPLIVGQPFLRVILLADHTACTLDTNALTNTRTTYTLTLIRVLMWEMPFHAEHHRYPGIPFHALARVHDRLKPYLGHVMSAGFIGAHRVIVSRFSKAD
jgi:fatty acid desaturase